MSNTLEKLCRQQGLSYEWDSDGLCVLAYNHYPEAGYSIKISPTANGRIGTLTVFPECKVKKIPNVGDLCSEVQKNFASGASLLFDDVGGYFFIYGVTDGGTLREYVNKLAHDCDIAKPLLDSVGEQGSFTQYSVWLAHLMPSEMGPRPQ